MLTCYEVKNVIKDPFHYVKGPFHYGPQYFIDTSGLIKTRDLINELMKNFFITKSLVLDWKHRRSKHLTVGGATHCEG